MPQYNYSLTKEIFEDFRLLAPPIRERSDRTIERMMVDPWAPELHPEKIHGAEPGVHSSRVNDSYRLVWKHIKPNDIVFLLVDQHDNAYQRASRKSFTLDNGIVRVADIREVGATTHAGHDDLFGASSRAGKQLGALFIGYRDQEILDWGVPQDVLTHIRALDNLNQLDSVERLLSPEVYNRLLEVALGIIERPVVQDEKLAASLAENQGGDDLCRFVTSEEFLHVLKGSLEEWMLFLAPHQRALVQRSYNGPARIKGVAGSGKTVVALHRACQLAKRTPPDEGKILFLTYGNRLPNVISHLLGQLIGEDTQAFDKIECSTVHGWCSRLIRSCGWGLGTVSQKTNAVLENAIEGTRQQLGSQFILANRDTSFFEEEIRYMIKGRDIRSQEDYLSLERSGRGTRLGVDERRVVWQVYEAYQAEMAAGKQCDYDDFILYALDLVRAGKMQWKYRAAIVDEIQDLTEATMKLIRAIIPPAGDDLFLVGDGLQRIYPGGYSLNRLGIDITGRGTILRRNYRNTQQILQAAHAMMGSLSFDDMDDDLSDIQLPEYSVRQGSIPELRVFPAVEQELYWVAQEIQRLIHKEDFKEKDFAVIYRSKPYDQLVPQHLGQKFTVVELQKDAATYFGDGIKRSTFHSVKGLEFKVVFVVGLTDGWLVPKEDWSMPADSLEEYMLRERRLLYVAMTRARDLLYLTCARGQPSRFFNDIPGQVIHRVR